MRQNWPGKNFWQIVNLLRFDILDPMRKKKVVLVGGCFDILHPGHIVFLQKAKKTGDKLIVLLESDEKIRELKGINRPVHTQDERAKILQAVRFVDQIIKLPYMESDSDYDQIITRIKPDIIALTMGYADTKHHERVSKLIGAELKYVTKMIANHSSSQILSFPKR